MDSVWILLRFPDLSSLLLLGTNRFRVQMGNKIKCSQEDNSLGRNKTLSSDVFSVLEKLSLHWGGMLDVVVICF